MSVLRFFQTSKKEKDKGIERKASDSEIVRKIEADFEMHCHMFDIIISQPFIFN